MISIAAESPLYSTLRRFRHRVTKMSETCLGALPPTDPWFTGEECVSA